MYKCTECGTEYDIKPEYCDCGNDTFEKVNNSTNNTQVQNSDLNNTVDDTQSSAAQNTGVNNSIKYTNKIKTKKEYSEFDRFKEIFDPISYIIFCACIILSLVIILFIGNPKEQTAETEEKVSEVQTVNIPNIDSFWNNAPPYVQEEEPEPEPEPTFIEKITAPIQKITTPAIEQKPQQTTTKNSVTTQSKPVVAKQTTSLKQPSTNQTQTQPQKTTTSNKSPVDPNITALTQRVQTNAQNSIKNQTQQTQVSTPKITAQTTQKQNQTQVTQSTPTIRTTGNATGSNTSNTTAAPTQTTAQTNTQKPQVDAATLKQELTNYKVALRNTIGKKINFTNVVGDGECIVSFKISSNGQLTSRAFSKKSSNLTLNDAVYSAMLATPTYNAPPSGYKNETLNLKVSFYNGNFDISLY